MRLVFLILFISIFNSQSFEIVKKFIPQSGSVNVSVSVSSTGTLTASTVDIRDFLKFQGDSVNFTQDTNFVLSGGVNGLSFDTDTLSIDATNKMIGIGLADPGSMLELESDSNVLGVEIRLTDTNASGNQWGIRSDKGALIFRDNSTGTNIMNIGDGASGGVAIGQGVTTASRPLQVSDVMRLVPRNSAPSSPSEGDIYVYDGATDALCVYLTGAWLSAAGGICP